MLFNLFSKTEKKEVPIKLPSPLNLRLGSAVEIDLLPFQMLADHLHCALPQGTQIIEAAGFIDLGAGAYLSRFYTADDGFIQISSTGGYETQHINDIKFFVFEQTEHLTSQQSVDYWCGNQGLIGKSTFRLNDNAIFQRAWDTHIQNRIEPVNLIETVHNKNTSIKPYSVEHLAMLYQKPLTQSEHFEYLLASLEFTNEDEATAVVSLGVDLIISSLNII